MLLVRKVWMVDLFELGFGREIKSFLKQSKTDVLKKRLEGGGRNTILGLVEDDLYDRIIDYRTQKIKVTREIIKQWAREMSPNQTFRASESWMAGFFKRKSLFLRRVTNITTLSDDELIQRAVSYMKFLENMKAEADYNYTILVDETAMYFEDPRLITVDSKGNRHVVLKSTGFASMRITCVLAVTASGKKLPPLLIYKASKQGKIEYSNGILIAKQPKAWINSDLFKSPSYGTLVVPISLIL
jgi:hypothetical protein